MREPRALGSHPDESRCAAHRTAVGPLERRHSSATHTGATVARGRLRLSIGIATERPWFTHYDPGVPHTLGYPAIPLQQSLTDTAARHPEAAAIVFGAVVAHRLIEASLSYAELDRLADRFAAGLQSLGVRKGDRLALPLPNCPQFVVGFYGALRAGAVVVPCNPLYTAPQLRRQLADSQAQTPVALSRLHAVRSEERRVGKEGRSR